jgi:hypothetical protein
MLLNINTLELLFKKPEVSAKYIFFVICFFYLFINIIYVIIIPFKNADYDQVDMEEEAEIIALALKEHEIDRKQFENEKVLGEQS